MTSPILGILSIDKKAKLFEEISIKGYKLNTQNSLYSLYSDINNQALKLCKDNQRISAKELPELIDIISEFMKRILLESSDKILTQQWQEKLLKAGF